VLAAALPEKRIFIQSDRGSRYIRIGTGAQAGLLLALVLAVGCLFAAAAKVTVDLAVADGSASGALVMQGALADRLNALTAERDARTAEARSAQARFQTAMEEIGRQQTALIAAVEARREDAAALEAMRARLASSVEAREALAEANGRLAAEHAGDATGDGPSGEDLAVTLAAVTRALDAAVAARDAASADREALAAELASAELALRISERRQEEMVGEISQVVVAAFEPLEGLLRQADLDVDSVLATLRADYSGQGGPLVPVGVSTRSFPGDEEAASRLDELMIDLDRMSLLRIAVGKVPYAMPVKATHRFTSGFGYRSDPKGRGRRMHAGVDFAAPTGTPIFATADGVVTSAGTESGYGQVVRIQHDFGFETVYAHQSRILVRKGQQVSRGDHIGDMGRTGRVTGVHLHYEVRLNGRPVNPMTYVEAAKNVF